MALEGKASAVVTSATSAPFTVALALLGRTLAPSPVVVATPAATVLVAVPGWT